MNIPDYEELPAGPAGGRVAWDLFGPTDSIGLLNLQTPARVVSAAALIRTGAVYPLNAPLNLLDPPLFGRSGYAHTVLDKANGFDDHIDGFYPQSSSQWDSLGHVAYAPGVFYNGASSDDIAAGRRNTVDAWARRGIAGRAVLLDLARLLADRSPAYDPMSNRAITVAEIEQARALAGVEIDPGDVLLLHTGWLARYLELSADARIALARDRLSVRAAGLEHTEEMARYLWNTHVCAVASDGPTVEVWPPDESPGASPFGFLHRVLIGGFGLAVGELWWLSDLAESCARDHRHEMFFTSSPLHIAGGIGAPANALAIK